MIKKYIKKYMKQNGYLWAILTVLAMLSMGFSGLLLNQPKPAGHQKVNVEPSTYIPKGFRLLTLDIENYQSVDQSFGQYGFVSLYIRDENRTKLIVKGLRMLRSPLNSKVFGVLVPEGQVKRLLAENKPFYVALQSDDSGGTEFVKKKPRKAKVVKRHIEIGAE